MNKRVWKLIFKVWKEFLRLNRFKYFQQQFRNLEKFLILFKYFLNLRILNCILLWSLKMFRKGQFRVIVNNFYEARATSRCKKMTRGVFTRLVSPMIYTGIWQDLFEHRVGNPITINLGRFFTFLSNFTQLQAEYLSNGLKRENSIATFRPSSDSNNYKQRTYEITLHETEIENRATIQQQERRPTFSPNWFE